MEGMALTIKVKRNTGMMGVASPVSLKVNSQVVKKLKHNEEYTISLDSEKTNIKANQWFFGSEEKQVEKGSTVNIKINSQALMLYLVSLIVVILGGFSNIILLSLIGLIGMIITIMYSTKHWFKLEVENKINQTEN